MALLTDWKNHDNAHDNAQDETPPCQFGIPNKRSSQSESKRYNKDGHEPL